MPHGARDWSNIGPSEEGLFGGIELSEVVARLGSPVTRDRRGAVIMFHTFQHGLPPAYAGYGGVDADHYLVAEPCATGGYAYKLIAGSSVNGFAYLACETAGRPIGRAGIEWSFLYYDPYSTLRLVLSTYTPEGYYDFMVRFRYAEDDVQLQDEDGNWVTVGGASPPPQSGNTFNNVKLVCDSESGHYVRLIINGQEYDLADQRAMFVEGGTGYTVYFYFYLVTSPGYNPYAVVDNFIFTTNEPA